MMHSSLNGGFWHLAIPNTITTLLRQEISCQLNLFLPTTLVVYFFNPSMASPWIFDEQQLLEQALKTFLINFWTFLYTFFGTFFIS